jgi:hypothetical protein
MQFLNATARVTCRYHWPFTLRYSGGVSHTPAQVFWYIAMRWHVGAAHMRLSSWVFSYPTTALPFEFPVFSVSSVLYGYHCNVDLEMFWIVFINIWKRNEIYLLNACVLIVWNGLRDRKREVKKVAGDFEQESQCEQNSLERLGPLLLVWLKEWLLQLLLQTET